MLCLVAQSCPTLGDPMDCSPPGSSVHGKYLGKNTRVCCHALLHGIFPIQGSNLSLLKCRQIFYCLESPGKPKNTGVGSLSLLQGIFPTQESKWGLLQGRQILYQLSYRGSPNLHTAFTILEYSEFDCILKFTKEFYNFACFQVTK